MKPSLHFSAISTERLKIRRFDENDLAALLAHRNDSELAKYASWDLPFTPTNAIALINQNQFLHPDSPGKNVSLGIELQASRKLIGELSLKTDHIDTTQVEFYIAIDRRYQNQAYASEASVAIFKYLFESRGKNKIKALADARNIRFIEFLKKIGMKQEAFFRENLWHRNKWCDQCLLATLKRDWLRPSSRSSLDFSLLFNSQ